MVKIVIYDCDGVIVESDAPVLHYYNGILEKCGMKKINWDESELKTMALSYADRDILEVLSNGDKALYAKMLEISRNEKSDDDFSDIWLQENIKEALEFVKANNLPSAVFTNRGSSLLNLLSHFGLDKYFDMLVTSNDVTLPKPSPEGLFKICERFGVEPCDALFIGDSPTDYHAAKSAGAKFLSFKKELFDARVISDHLEIKKHLK